MKFRVERDVLADAVAWAARALPVRPSAPVLAGLLIEAGALDAGPRACSSRRSTTRPRPGRPSAPRSATRAGHWSPGGCSPTSAAACPTSRSSVDRRGAKATVTCGSARFTLPTMPVEDYPTLPAMPEARGTVPSGLFANAVNQAVTAAGPRRHAPGPDRCPHRDGGGVDRDAGDRPFPSLQPRAHLVAGRARRQLGRPGAGQGARRHRQVADRRHRDHHRARRDRLGRGDHRLRGRRRAAAARRTTTRLLDGSSPRCARCSRPST